MNPDYWSQLDEQQRQLSEAEFSSLNLILGEKDTQLPFYTYADDSDLNLVSAMDGRVPGEAFLGAWNEDEDFPWDITVQFPRADDIMCYDIQAWLSDDSGEEDALGFALWLEPLYVSNPKQEPLLMLQVKPDEYLDYTDPLIEFQSERKAVCRVDFETRMIQITLRFRILVDLEQHLWRFLE